MHLSCILKLELRHDVYAMGIALYTITLTLTLAAMVKLVTDKVSLHSKHKPKICGVYFTFHFFLVIALAMRVAWWCFKSGLVLERGDTRTAIEQVFQRGSLTAFMIVFTTVLLQWISIIKFKEKVMSGRRLTGYMTVNIVVVIFNIITVAVFVASDDKDKEGNPVYEAGIFSTIAIELALCISFLTFGIILLVRIKKTVSNKLASRRSIIKLIIHILVYTACAACRCAMYSYRPITGRLLDIWLFHTLAYFVPELIPTVLQLWFFYSGRRQRMIQVRRSRHATKKQSIARNLARKESLRRDRGIASGSADPLARNGDIVDDNEDSSGVGLQAMSRHDLNDSMGEGNVTGEVVEEGNAQELSREEQEEEEQGQVVVTVVDGAASQSDTDVDAVDSIYSMAEPSPQEASRAMEEEGTVQPETGDEDGGGGGHVVPSDVDVELGATPMTTTDEPES